MDNGRHPLIEEIKHDFRTEQLNKKVIIQYEMRLLLGLHFARGITF